MMTWKFQTLGAVCVVLVALLFVVAEVEARRGGGGGRGGGGRNFSRSGPASQGTVRSQRPSSVQRSGNQSHRQDRSVDRSDRQNNRGEQRGDRGDQRDDTREDRQQHRDDTREDRQDYVDDKYDDRRDWVDDRYRRRVGTVLTVSSFRSLSCTSSTIYVDGVNYYRCGSDWYSRAYHGGNVTYVIVDAPAGY